MIIFNLNKLCRKLAYDELSEKRKYIYILVGVILHQINIFSEIISANNYSSSALYLIISIIVTLFMLRVLFRINEKADNKYFIERYFVIGVAIDLLFLIYYILLLAIEYAFEKYSPQQSMIGIYTTLFYLLYYTGWAFYIILFVSKFKYLRTIIQLKQKTI